MGENDAERATASPVRRRSPSPIFRPWRPIVRRLSPTAHHPTATANDRHGRKRRRTGDKIKKSTTVNDDGERRRR
jgi:hypothetical protein